MLSIELCECKRSKQPFADDKQPHPIEILTIRTGTSHLCLYPTVCMNSLPHSHIFISTS